MTHIGAGRRYAEAAFELATRDKAVDAWQRDLAASSWPTKALPEPLPETIQDQTNKKAIK